jgi:hypothetical protein
MIGHTQKKLTIVAPSRRPRFDPAELEAAGAFGSTGLESVGGMRARGVDVVKRHALRTFIEQGQQNSASAIGLGHQN